MTQLFRVVSFGIVVVLVAFVSGIVTLECDGEVRDETCRNSTSKQNKTSRTSAQQNSSSTTSAPLSIPESSTTFSSQLTSTSTSPKSKETKEGRALNFTLDNTSNNLSPNNSAHDAFGDLSDVTIDESDEEGVIMGKIIGPKEISSENITIGICEKGGLTYENGEKLEIDCDTICTCTNGKMDCTDRCLTPFVRKGKKIQDPLCIAKPSDDPCCNVLVCSADTETEPLEICTYKNETYNRGDTFNKGCDEVCFCEAGGKQSCKPRCTPPSNKTSDRCVEVPSPEDPCCKKVLCDVTLDDHESDKEEHSPKIRLISAKYVNATTLFLNFDHTVDNDTEPLIDVSDDQMKWTTYRMPSGGYLTLREPGRYVKLENSNDVIVIQHLELANKDNYDNKLSDGKCVYKGRSFNFEEEYNDNCTSLCVCMHSGMKCLKIECPTYFGTDVLDPHCVEWETVPADFKPKAPKCCPDELRCKSNGSCEYLGKMYSNWQPIPENITGCDKRCYCEMGKVECQNQCPPVTAFPPPELNCGPDEATIGHLPDDDCCMYWICNPEGHQNATEPTMTTSNKHGNKTNTTDEILLEALGDKQPSKVLGPLLVYTNHDDGVEDDYTLGKLPTILPDENPFFHKPEQNLPKPIPEKPNKISHSDKYPGSPSPSFKKTSPPPDREVSFKPAKSSNRNKHPSKDNTLFVTPPSQPHDNSFSDPIQNSVPFIVAAPPKHQQPHIQIHGKGNPHELIQFINEHPEIANYPPGSVLEIHDVPNRKPAGHPFIGSNLPPLPGNRPPPLVPYVIPQHTNDVPGGVALEHFLQELHKNVQQQGQPLGPFGPSQFGSVNNGLVIAQSGPVIPTRPNATFQGHGGNSFPGNYPHSPYVPQEDVIMVNTLEAVDPHRVKLVFMVPPIIVGLHGRVEVRYTYTEDDDLSTWEQQVFAPPNDLIATPQLEFDLLGLKADTEYKIKITITLRDVHNTPSSRVYKIRTPKEVVTTTLPPMIPIEPDLAITDINATWVTVTWRKFTDYELQFIDGVQLRFKEIDGKIYAATPLIHRAVTTYTLEKLKPNTKYEIGIFFIPFPGQRTELHSEHMLHFTTANEIDTYGFNVTLEIQQIKSTSVEIVWSGVPYPEDKYVSIYRAIYQSDSGKEDQSTFKMAKRDSPTKTLIMDLKPGTRYRLWLEVYLTNGKVKTSNVQDFITRPRVAPSLSAVSQHDKLSRQHLENRGDYYGPLVIVAILAAIAILSTLILLLILIRRHNQNKAAITPPTRVSQSAYDNPTYKVEIQQETMGL